MHSGHLRLEISPGHMGGTKIFAIKNSNSVLNSCIQASIRFWNTAPLLHAKELDSV